MLDKPETAEPRIFITVLRMVDGKQLATTKEISLLTFLRARFPGGFLEAEINHALAEIGYNRLV